MYVYCIMYIPKVPYYTYSFSILVWFMYLALQNTKKKSSPLLWNMIPIIQSFPRPRIPVSFSIEMMLTLIKVSSCIHGMIQNAVLQRMSFVCRIYFFKRILQVYWKFMPTSLFIDKRLFHSDRFTNYNIRSIL